MNKLLSFLTVLTFGFSYQICHEPTGSCYDVSTDQAFYFFETVTVDGELATPCGGSAAGDCDDAVNDVIIAYCNDTVVGFDYILSSYTTIPVMGDAGPGYEGYCKQSNGDVPSFKYYDASIDQLLSEDFFEFTAGSIGQDGTVAPFAPLSTCQVGNMVVSNVYDCTDSDACNYNPDANVDDGSCTVNDCNGDCGGVAFIDSCGVCSGGNSGHVADSDIDCAGDCFGSAVDTWCDGVCNSFNVFDQCGSCNDPNGENAACTGCTDDIADNTDEGCSSEYYGDECFFGLDNDGDGLQDDCVYTVPAVDDLFAEAGGERAILSWTAPDAMGDAEYTFDVYNGAGEMIKEDISSLSNEFSTTILGLEPEVEACFTVVSKNLYGVSENSNLSCCLPFPAVGMSWGFQVKASIDGFGTFEESDIYNYFGVSGNATNTYDEELDIPEPPTPVGNYIEMYFPHGNEWAHPWDTDKFTQDVRRETAPDDADHFGSNLMVWSAEVSSNMDGDTQLEFLSINDQYPGYPIYVLLDGTYHAVESGTILSTYCTAGVTKHFDIILGNIVPQAPDNLSSSSDDRAINLDWDADGSSLMDIGNRYPALSYNVYRDGSLAYEAVDATDLHDDADVREPGQGLMYESAYDYIVTGSNEAGESTDGHMVTYSDNTTEHFGGRQSETSNVTYNNIDPVASAIALGGGDYTVDHDGDPSTSDIDIDIDGSGTSDANGDPITVFEWSLIAGDDLSVDDSDDMLELNISNPHACGDVAKDGCGDGEADSYTFGLYVESMYPVKLGNASDLADEPLCVDEDAEFGCDNCSDENLDLVCDGDGMATRSNSTSVTITVNAEPNEGPTAAAEINPVLGNDYSDFHQQWIVPHDGDPYTLTAMVALLAEPASSDPENDDLDYLWDTGLAAEIYEDINGSGSYDYSEPFIDCNADQSECDYDVDPVTGEWVANESFTGGNGVWDDEELFTTDAISADREAGAYNYTITVTDSYGYSDSAPITIGVLPEPNAAPMAEAGADQLHFLLPDDPNVYDIWEDFEDENGNYVYDEGEPFTNESRYCTGLDGSISDPESDDLSFDWSDGGDLSHDLCLPAGVHTFTLCTTDAYGASDCDDMTVTINLEPAPAVPGDLVVTTSLYFTEFTFSSSNNTIEYGDSQHVFGMNAVSYNIYRDGDLILNNPDNQGFEYHMDNNLSPSTEYCYAIAGVNSHGDEGDKTEENCVTTGNLPTVTITSPNGAEIYEVGSSYPVEWELTDPQFISKVEVFYSDERQDETLEAAEEGAAGAGAEGIAWNNVSLVGHADEVSTVYEHANIRVRITDIGNFEGDNRGVSEDSSDEPFTMTTNMLTRAIDSGWHMFGTALTPSANTMAENLEADLGEWGTGWIAYDESGNFEDLELELGKGYFLAVTADLENMESLTLIGDPVTSPVDADGRADLELDGGWTMISNPLVSTVHKSQLTVNTNGEDYSWDDAVAFGFVSPTVYGWDSGYTSNQNLVRFEGNWMHTSRALTLKVRPHGASALARTNDIDGWKLSMRATDVNSLAASDMITVGITENANNEFTYGEDEYDLPNPMVDSYVDLFINNMSWIGKEDVNGNTVETPYFAADIRSLPNMNDAQIWNVSGVAHNVTGDVELTWNMDEIDDSYLVHLQVSGRTYDLREENSVIVSQDELSNMNILIGSGSMGIDIVEIPETFSLSSAYPNPFNPTTNMTLGLDSDGQVSMMVYNLVGQVVDVLVDGYMNAGYHNVTWDAANVPSGVYIVKVTTGSNTSIQKVMLMK